METLLTLTEAIAEALGDGWRAERLDGDWRCRLQRNDRYVTVKAQHPGERRLILTAATDAFSRARRWTGEPAPTITVAADRAPTVIAREIVRVQKEFLDKGITSLRPLTMNEVAQVVGIHETTVSRAIASKYMQTPRGTFEMKYFFTPGYKTADGQSISNKTIKDAISHLVAEEDTANPLSDQAMVEMLAEQGTKVARRTVAKYREELKILPSHLRRQY